MKRPSIFARLKVTMRARRFTLLVLFVVLVISVVTVVVTYLSLSNHPPKNPENSITIGSVLTLSTLDDLESVHSWCYSNPRQALDDFLSYLQRGDFPPASRLYAGEYLFVVARMTPESMSREDREEFMASFLRDHCTGYGTCLSHQIVSEQQRSKDEYWYEVIFDVEHGGYEFCGPNVGDAAAVTPRCSTNIQFRVQRLKGCFQSLDIPPITP